MSKVKVHFDKKAVRQYILQGEGTYNLIKAEAESRCGANQHVRIWKGYDRINARVFENIGENQS